MDTIARPSLVARTLDAIGLDTPARRAWAMYDWADSAYYTTIVTAIYPLFYRRVVAADLGTDQVTGQWALINSIALLIGAVISPVLGAIASKYGMTRRLLFSFTALGVVATGLLAVPGHGAILAAAAIYVVAMLGYSSALVFYDALLSSVADDEHADRVSAAGYALGYLGGGLLLAVQVVMLVRPGWFGLPPVDPAHPMASVSVRIAFVMTALWWAVFTVPLWRRVPSADDDAVVAGGVARPPLGPAIRDAFRELGRTLASAGRYRDLFVFLGAYWLFSDGIGTFQKMAASYGDALHLSPNALVGALLMTQFVGVPFSFAFALLAGRLGARRALYLGLWVYAAIGALAYFITANWHFFALAFGVAMVQGGTQALSRSLFAGLVPRGRSAEFFAFFSVSSKVAGILGPLTIFALTTAGFGSRTAILVLVVLFVAGIAALSLVDLERGRAVAAQG